MVGGGYVLVKIKAHFGAYKTVPLVWWLPQKERAVLAIVSTVFWCASIAQATDSEVGGSSVLAFYGLGLLYVLCVIANVLSGVGQALARYNNGQADDSQVRALLQLFVILASMVICNTLVLMIYLLQGITPTPLDWISVSLAMAAYAVITLHYGFKKALYHPYARGYLALAFKALPQLTLAAIFMLQPVAVLAFTSWSLGSLTILAALRFWPSWLAFRRDTSSAPLRGLLIGESGNMLSLALMVGAWIVMAIVNG